MPGRERRHAEHEQGDRARGQAEQEPQRRHVLEAQVAREVAAEHRSEPPEQRGAERIEHRREAVGLRMERVRDAHEPRAHERGDEVGAYRGRGRSSRTTIAPRTANTGCTFCSTTGVTKSWWVKSASVNRIVATAYVPALIAIAARM